MAAYLASALLKSIDGEVDALENICYFGVKQVNAGAQDSETHTKVSRNHQDSEDDALMAT